MFPAPPRRARAATTGGSTPPPARRRPPFPLQQGPEAFDQLLRPIGQIRQGPLLDLAVLAIGLPQQDRGRRFAVGDDLDIHGTNYATKNQECKRLYPITWVHNRDTN